METAIGLQHEARVVCPDEIKKQFKEGELGLVLDWQIKDAGGKVIKEGIKKGESFTAQFLQLLYCKMLNVSAFAPVDIVDTSDVTQKIANDNLIFVCDAGAGIVTNGIIAGTGVTAPDITDRHIETLIAHGVGAGQLQYSAMTYGAPAADATTSQFTITRNFANGSGGAITVNEIALYVKSHNSAWAYSSYGGGITQTLMYFMTIRDTIAGGISVGNGQTLTVNYRPQAVI